MVVDDIEGVMQRVRDAPDLDSRAAILNLDVAAVRGASRRFIAITWSVGILVALVVAVVPTARFFALIDGHSVSVAEWHRIGDLLAGALSTVVLFALSSFVLGFPKLLLSRVLPTRQTIRFVLMDVLLAIFIPSVAALPFLWVSSPLFLYGALAGAALAAMPRPRDFDFVGALRVNKPRIGAAVARQQAAGTPLTLVGGRARWLALQSVGNILAAPFALIVILKHPWAAIAVMVVYFVRRTSALILEMRGRYRTAVIVHLAIAIAIVAVALVVAGSVLWPNVEWTVPAVPA